MTSFGIFKDSSWRWQKDFSVPNLMSPQIFIMKINGQWPIDFGKYLPTYFSFLSRPLILLYYTFWCLLASHIAVFFFVALVIKLRSDNSTIPEITNVFIQSVIYGFAFYSTIHFQLYYKDMAQMVNLMIENFKMRSARGLTYVTTEPCYRIAKAFSIFYTVLCIAGVLHFILLPIYLQVRELPLPCWYPFNYYPRPIFELVYISQCMGQIQVALAFANADILIICVVVFILGQYDILFCSLKNIRYTALLINGLTENLGELKRLQHQINFDDEEMSQYYYSFEQKEDLDNEELAEVLKEMKLKLRRNRFDGRSNDTFLLEYKDELAMALRECIVHHQNIVNVCNILERFYNPMVFVKSLQVTLQICNLAYVSTKTTSSLMQNINYLEYLFLTLFDIMIFGYAGNWLKEQSVRVGDAILRSPWYLCGGPLRRSLLIVLANNFHPVKLTGGKFFILDYTKVIAIVKASFSFYTLLQKLG